MRDIIGGIHKYRVPSAAVTDAESVGWPAATLTRIADPQIGRQVERLDGLPVIDVGKNDYGTLAAQDAAIAD